MSNNSAGKRDRKGPIKLVLTTIALYLDKHLFHFVDGHGRAPADVDGIKFKWVNGTPDIQGDSGQNAKR
jgi:hypothetical protein